MARRKARTTKRTTRRKPKLNLVNAAQTYFQTAIVTQAAFRATPIEFITGQQSITSPTYGVVGGVRTQTGSKTTTGYLPIRNGTSLTLPELLGFDRDGTSINPGGYSIHGNGGLNAAAMAMKENIALNGGLAKPIVQTIVLNASFAVGKKLMRRQLSGVRKGLKMAGLSKDVTV